jgi:hypothetical protein
MLAGGGAAARAIKSATNWFSFRRSKPRERWNTCGE